MSFLPTSALSRSLVLGGRAYDPTKVGLAPPDKLVAALAQPTKPQAQPRQTVTQAPRSEMLTRALMQNAYSGQPIETPVEMLGQLAQAWAGNRSEEKRLQAAEEKKLADEAETMAAYQKVAAEIFAGGDPVQAALNSGNPELVETAMAQILQSPDKEKYGFTEVNGVLVRTGENSGEATPVYTSPAGGGDLMATDKPIYDPNKGEWIMPPAAATETFRRMSPEEVAQWGLDPGRAWGFDKDGKPIAVDDKPVIPEKPPTGIQEYEYYKQQELDAGREPVSFAQFQTDQKKAGATSISNVIGGEGLTPGQKKIDESFADEYIDWIGKGGFSDVDKQLGQLNDALAIIESNPGITGPAIGLVPDYLQSFFNEQGVIAKNKVEEVVQRNLRAVLGAQFTEREGERLIARAYNPQISPVENAKRVRALLVQIRLMAEAKQAAVDYFNENGTLRGFSGTRPSLSRLEQMYDAAGGAATAPGVQEPATAPPPPVSAPAPGVPLQPGTYDWSPNGLRPAQ